LRATLPVVYLLDGESRFQTLVNMVMVSRPRLSDVVNQKTAKFTIDTLVEMLNRVGKPVRLAFYG
jgi:predicted XRE-type DNA-binding protein